MCVRLGEESKDPLPSRPARECAPKKPAADPLAAKQAQVQRDCIKAACLVSLLYDVAGRSEDAFHLSWERVTYSKGGGGHARLVKGKTTARTAVFSPRTEALLREHGGPGAPAGPLFDFNSANAMIKWLDRAVKRVRLPPGNKIEVARFQSHNLRTSKLTWLSQQERWSDAQIQHFSGHKDIKNLYRYIKVDADQT